MFEWFKSWRVKGSAAPPPAPRTRRLKTYQADSGYVYQYYFEGRHCMGTRMEFIFSVSADRTTYHRVMITIPDDSLAPSEENLGRRLAENERYGVAKIALFRLFDTQSCPEGVRPGAAVDAGMAGEYLAILGI